MLFQAAAALALLSTSAYVQAQVGGVTVSANCQQAFVTVASSDVAQCLNVNGLATLLSTPATASWVQPIDAWIGGVCSAPACSTTSLGTAFDTIATGCATDFTAWNVTAADLATVKQAIITYYPTARKVICLRDSTAGNAFCVTTELTILEGLLGQPLNANSLTNAYPTIAQNYATWGKQLVCTRCGQAIYATIKADFPSVGTTYDSVFSGLCGADFVTGVPTGIASASSLAATREGNACGRLTAMGFEGMASLVTVALGVTLLA